MILIYLILLIGLGFFIYLLIFRYKAPWVPIWKSDLARLDKMINLIPGKTFYDLGCGNGRVLFYLARKNPQVQFVGIDLSLILIMICLVRKYLGHYDNVNFKLGDYSLLDYNLADYLYCFTMPLAMTSLAQKISQTLHKDIFLIAYCFPVEAWTQYLLIADKPPKDNGIYLYHYKKNNGEG